MVPPQSSLSLNVYKKYTLADVNLFWLLKLGNIMLTLNKDNFEFVAQFSCLLGHSVY